MAVRLTLLALTVVAIVALKLSFDDRPQHVPQPTAERPVADRSRIIVGTVTSLRNEMCCGESAKPRISIVSLHLDPLYGSDAGATVEVLTWGRVWGRGGHVLYSTVSHSTSLIVRPGERVAVRAILRPELGERPDLADSWEAIEFFALPRDCSDVELCPLFGVQMTTHPGAALGPRYRASGVIDYSLLEYDLVPYELTLGTYVAEVSERLEIPAEALLRSPASTRSKS